MKSFFENKKVSENCYEKCLSLNQLFILFTFIYAPWELNFFKIELQISEEIVTVRGLLPVSCTSCQQRHCFDDLKTKALQFNQNLH